jgi:hypothetical protein
MAEPQRPGWYPAPDGSATEQWWNGASWSDSKRGIGGAALPGLPTYRAAPPSAAPGSEPAPAMPPTQPPYPTLASQTAGRTVNLTNSSSTIAIVMGVIGIAFFAPLGIAAIWLGAKALKRPETVGTQRTLAIVGILLGIVALVWGAIQVVIFIVAIASGIDYSS